MNEKQQRDTKKASFGGSVKQTEIKKKNAPTYW